MPQTPGHHDTTERPEGTGEVLAAALQAARALAALHAQGRVHGALCPAALAWQRPSRHLDLRPPGAHAQPVAYLSPEQTGRLPAAVDARSDLYSLGLVLYCWLVGRPPFTSDDLLAQVHWHLAGRAVPPADAVPGVPPVLSSLVMRLIEKSPAARYPDAATLAADLERCDGQWRANGRIADFVLAGGDDAAPPLAAGALVGRAAEQRALTEAWQRCRGGARLFVLVEGYAGSGKTSLVEQALRPLAGSGFIVGKADQVVRSVPFGTLIRAFSGWVLDLLGASDDRLRYWRAALLDALGANAGVLAQLLPEVVPVIGAQPAPQVLDADEAHNRLRRVLQQFIGVLARADHPLVLFLDDLQWADAATVALLETLAGSGDIGHLLLVCALRDNELDAASPLAHALAALQPQRVVLEPLDAPALATLLAAALRAEPGPLAALVHDKTAGNPFFAMQFLQGLQRSGHLRWQDGRWHWALDAIRAAPLADDVVDLLARRIARLAPAEQQLLVQAACIGNRFDAATLATVAERPAGEVRAALEAACAEGLLLNDGAAWRFLHDRVQQAAYAHIAPGERAAVHLQIGRLLLDGTPAGERDAALFDIVHHLNLGRRLVRAPAERARVAALDLEAGRRAKTATAFEAALALFDAGSELADGAAPAFELQLEAAECRMLCGRPDAAEAHAALLAAAPTRIDRTRVLRLRCVQLERQGRHAEVLGVAREALALFGVVLPAAAHEIDAALQREIEAVDRLRAGRPIDTLDALPVMDDPATRIVMAMLTDIWSAAYLLGEPTLSRLISALLVRLSLESGNAPESAYGYVTHAITVGALRGDLRAADAWGHLALAVNRRFDDRRLRAKILQQFHAHVNFWCQPVRTCIAHARHAHEAGLDGGDLLYAGYAAGTEAWAALASTQDLPAFVREYTPRVAVIERLHNQPFADSLRQMLGWARALMGQTASPTSMSGAGFDEDAWLATYGGQRFFACVHAVCRLQLAVLVGSAAEAEAAARHAAALVDAVPGTLWPLLHEFWHAMALARAGGAAARPVLQRAHAAFAAREPFNAENHRPQALLLAAELAMLEGRDDDAVAACEAAVEFTAAHPLLPFQALAHERLAQAHGRRRRPALQALHRTRACKLYAAWGAAAKAAQLSDRPVPAAAVLPAAQPVEALDLASVLKATQAIAAATDLAALRERLLHIAIENAGAERGALVLDEDGRPVVHVWQPGQRPPPRPLDHQDAVPADAVQRVRRTGQPWTSDDATQAGVPLRHQGRTLGVLYVEHRHAPGVFGAGRLEVLQALATQAAISLENAQLVDGLRRALADVQQLKEALEAENSVLRRDLIANVSHDLRTPLVSLRGYLELMAARGDGLDAGERLQYLGIALRQSERLATRIDELFELAKLDVSDIALQRERFAFAELVTDVVQKFAVVAEGLGLTLALELPERLPLVSADLGLVERVLENLIGNALKHTPAGGRIVVAARTADDATLVAEVRDSGHGIPATDLPQVFERGWRGVRHGEGAGLGLAIARRIVELHGGRIGAASTPGAGSRFWFSLPVQA